MDVIDRPRSATPLEKVAEEVVPVALKLFGRPSARSLTYVSSPITTGKQYFELLSAEGSISPTDKVLLRAQNAQSAGKIVARLTSRLPRQLIVNPWDLEEPKGWSQDHFNGMWMYFIENYAGQVVMADNWQYSTGCTWELTQAILSRVPLFTETLDPLRVDRIGTILATAPALVREQESWKWANWAAGVARDN